MDPLVVPASRGRRVRPDMTPRKHTRRQLLATGTGMVLVALPGCSDRGGDGTATGNGSTPHPDAGTDSYGIFLENRTSATQKVRVHVTQPFGDDTPLDTTMDIEGGATKDWNQVITENKEYSVGASINEGIEDSSGSNRLKSDSIFVTPGSDDAPDVTDIKIKIAENKDAGLYVDVDAEMD